jgi:hypothetical protein
MPEIRFEPTTRYRPDCNWLARYARSSQSQLGQDGILEKIFEVIGEGNKFCIEFGAWDGVKYSNTWELIAQKGWSGILIEGNPDRCRDIVRNHNNNPKLQVVNALVWWEGDSRLDAILERCDTPADIDLLGIDIDGNDFHVWNAVEKHKPRVVLIEFNPSVPNDVYFVQDADPEIRQGSSLRAMIELGKKKGYSLVCTRKIDAFFVRDEYFPLFEIESNDIDSMYDNRNFITLLFHGYDGTLFTAGRKNLIWCDGEFDDETFQIRPKEKRFFKT